MKEFIAPGEIEIAPTDNPLSAMLAREAEHPNAVAMAYRSGERFIEITIHEFADQVRKLAKGFIGMGIEPGSMIAIYCKTRREFTYLDYAIWAAGCVTVPIYESSAPQQVEWIVGNSGAAALICENAELKDRFDEVSGSLPDCKHVFVIDQNGMSDIKEHGTEVSDADLKARHSSIAHEDMATLVYTSGTTGRPKGCVITHGNFIWDVRQVVSTMPDLFLAGSSTLMFLPLAHILARVVQVGCVTEGVVLGYSTGIKNLVEELAMFPPTWVFAVPRVFEKVFNSAQAKATSRVQAAIFKRAADTAVEYSKQSRSGDVSKLTAVEHGLYDKLVYGKIRAAMGGNLKFSISGGAPLGDRLGHFFDGIGITILEGYGLTETTAAATLNTPDEMKIGTVGKAIPGSAVAIDPDDGEVLLKGRHIFDGYWKNDEASAEVLGDDGWFHTGDIGELDSEGYLRITGRKKDLIVTAGGKNVAPAILEDRLRAHRLVGRAVVIGDKQPFIAALITIDGEELPKWAHEQDKHTSDPADLLSELVDDPDLIASIQEAVNDANRVVSRAESIRTFRILPRQFSIETGELTPTLKVRRIIVLESYSRFVEEIYAPR
jgi:long-chain acyl-CoA synthetase